MEFGIFSNGFRPHTSAAQTYDEDIYEIVLADQLGFRDAYISEHHGERPYVGKVDTIPAPEFLMCKAAALTKRIRLGAAVKLIHLHHPVDVAVQAAVVDHLIGNSRFIFGFGTGFAAPLFSVERGLSFETRHERTAESLELILKCWTNDEPFDWEGKHWRGKGIIALPKPYRKPHMPIATATESDHMIALAAERGYILLSAFFESPSQLRQKSRKYSDAAIRVGKANPLRNISAARVTYIARSEREAIEDLRSAVEYEVTIQAERGFLKMLKSMFGIDMKADRFAIERLVEAGFYNVGEPDAVAGKLKEFYDASGGFGTLLVVTGKDWATREKRANSLRMFMENVAPQLRDLIPTDVEAGSV